MEAGLVPTAGLFRPQKYFRGGFVVTVVHFQVQWYSMALRLWPPPPHPKPGWWPGPTTGMVSNSHFGSQDPSQALGKLPAHLGF